VVGGESHLDDEASSNWDRLLRAGRLAILETRIAAALSPAGGPCRLEGHGTLQEATVGSGSGSIGRSLRQR
jgi:hypothetical protein